MTERYLTPEEAAERLGIHARTLRKWLRTDKFKGVKVGRLWRISEAELAGILTPAEVAVTLSISPKTVREWLRTGNLKGQKIGGLWLLRQQDLEEYLQKQSRLTSRK